MSLAHIFGSLLILDDRSNRVLRILDVNGTTIKVYTVCAPRDLDHDTYELQEVDLRRYSGMDCLLKQVRIRYSLSIRMK